MIYFIAFLWVFCVFMLSFMLFGCSGRLFGFVARRMINNTIYFFVRPKLNLFFELWIQGNVKITLKNSNNKNME